MIEDCTLQYLGHEYVWSCDSRMPSPRTCWSWTRSDHFVPTSSISQILCGLLLKERLNTLIAKVERHEWQRYAGILRWMGCQAEVVDALHHQGIPAYTLSAIAGFLRIHWHLSGTNGHHRVYVIELDEKVRSVSRVRQQNPDSNAGLPCLYVGLTGLKAEERFEKHLAGEKSSWFVKNFGVQLLPYLSEGLCNMPFKEAQLVESTLAIELRRQGHVVTGGH